MMSPEDSQETQRQDLHELALMLTSSSLRAGKWTAAVGNFNLRTQYLPCDKQRKYCRYSTCTQHVGVSFRDSLRYVYIVHVFIPPKPF